MKHRIDNVRSEKRTLKINATCNLHLWLILPRDFVTLTFRLSKMISILQYAEMFLHTSVFSLESGTQDFGYVFFHFLQCVCPVTFNSRIFIK